MERVSRDRKKKTEKKTPREKAITAELPALVGETGYKPLDRDEEHKVQFALTMEQIDFIEAVAEKFDLSFTNAFGKVWKESFDLLVMQVQAHADYADLAPIKPKSKVWG